MPRQYIPSPTAADFLRATGFFLGIMGVVGSGKTSALVQKTIRIACKQFPNKDGIRQVRAAVVRNHYPELKTTTIKTFDFWYGDILQMKWDVPITGRIYRKLQDGTTLDLELVFIAVDRPEDTGKLRSLDLTFAVINEASEIDETIIDYLRGRVGRYPAEDDGGATWDGILADTNPPSTAHWWYRYAELEKPVGFKFFRQPPALLYDADKDIYTPNPDAENIEHLKGGYRYYYKQLEGAKQAYINTMILGNYGVSAVGTPIHQAYSDHLHVSREFLKVDPNLSTCFGMDFGLNPALVFGQMSMTGQLLIVGAVHDFNVSLEEFMDDTVMPYRHNFLRVRGLRGFGDPAGESRSALDKRNAYMMMASPQYRMPVNAVITNKFQTRKESVDKFLIRRNGIIIDPRLAFLREALGGGYKYSKGGSSEPGVARLNPEKNKYSHIAEALQYLCMGYMYGEKNNAFNQAYYNTKEEHKEAKKYYYV